MDIPPCCGAVASRGRVSIDFPFHPLLRRGSAVDACVGSLHGRHSAFHWLLATPAKPSQHHHSRAKGTLTTDHRTSYNSSPRAKSTNWWHSRHMLLHWPVGNHTTPNSVGRFPGPVSTPASLDPTQELPCWCDQRGRGDGLQSHTLGKAI